MKILACHNYYQQDSGENLVFKEETEMLEERGETVIRHTCHNDAVQEYGNLSLACKTIWNREAANALRAVIRRTKPHVMHCTNTFPLLSPAVYGVARSENVPVVQSLHNYRLMCPKATFFRAGQVCEDCLGKKFPWPGIVHGCYRDSRAASAVVTGMLAVHNLRNTWSRDVDLYIACTRFCRDKLIEAGLNGDKIVVKQNFVRRDPGVVDHKENFAIFVGRLIPEKGITELLAIWPRLRTNTTLKVVGGGELEAQVRAAADRNPRIECLGELPWDQTMTMIGRATCVILPSICYETFGRAIPEAYAKGTPVAVSGTGAMAELVDDGRTGLLFDPRDPADMLAKVELLLGDKEAQERLRLAARREYEEKYTADVNCDLQLEIYKRHLVDAQFDETIERSRPVSSHRTHVSLGVPVYNGARYLGAALESLLAQTFEDFELVISDNASTDETEEICREYAARDRRIRYVRQPQNIGAAANFNRVFELSRSELFSWAASDDVRSPTFLEKCVEVLDDDPEVHWCHTRSSHIGPDGKLLENPMLQDVSYVAGTKIGQGAATAGPRARLATRSAHQPHHRFQAVLLGHGGCIDSYGLMRSEAVRRTRLILPYFGAEKVFLAEMALAGRYHEVPETLFFLRVHDAAAGALTTAAEQQAYFAPRAVGGFTRLKLLAAYLGAIGRADLSIVDRARCSRVLLLYLLQIEKWGNVLRKAFSGAGVGGRNLTMLDSREDSKQERNRHS